MLALRINWNSAQVFFVLTHWRKAMSDDWEAQRGRQSQEDLFWYISQSIIYWERERRRGQRKNRICPISCRCHLQQIKILYFSFMSFFFPLKVLHFKSFAGTPLAISSHPAVLCGNQCGADLSKIWWKLKKNYFSTSARMLLNLGLNYKRTLPFMRTVKGQFAGTNMIGLILPFIYSSQEFWK